MPSSKPKAACVVRIVTGLRMGAASRNTMLSGTVKPLRTSPRASGTLPHSHTGRNMPNSEMTARLPHGFLGRMRMSQVSGIQTCTRIDSAMPSTMNGSDSMMTLVASVMRSCAASGRGASPLSAVTARRPTIARMPSTPSPAATT